MRFFPWRARELWRPVAMAIDARERLRVVGGACVGLGLAAWLSHVVAPWGGAWPWLVAPIGASTVLVFAVPASPLAQPWAVVVGNTVSAAFGVACARFVPWPEGAAALAVAGAIGLMLLTRSLHPPGGAMALLMVLSGTTEARVVLAPVALNSILLVAAGMVYNTATGRRYPHAAGPVAAAAPPTIETFAEADLDAVLARYNQVLDVPRDDLHDLVRAAQEQAYRRRMQTLRCRDLMTPDPQAVEFGTALHDAWALMRRHQIKALPVVDRYRHLVGIVTQADFLRHAGLDDAVGLSGLDGRLKRLLQATPGPRADKPEVVGQIMSRQVRVVSADRPLADLVPLFSAGGHHHIPVIGPGNRLQGMLTPVDLVAALAWPATGVAPPQNGSPT